jgi:hypothetical protein
VQHIACIGKIRNATKIWPGNLQGKGHRWVYNNKIYFRGIVCKGVDWTELAQDSVRCQVFVNAVMSLRVRLKQVIVVTWTVDVKGE